MKQLLFDTEILTPTSEHMARAAQALLKGGVVAIPTETVYGLAGNIHLPQAINRIFTVKERPSYDPLIVHVYWNWNKEEYGPQWGTKVLEELEHRKIIDLTTFSPSLKAKISRLLQALWPGPLTLVLPKHSSISDAVTSGLPSVAVRMPQHPVAQAILLAANVPLAAPSANRFGRISPTSATDVMMELGGRLPYILDGGPCQVGVESTVLAVDVDVDRESPYFRLLRPGGVSKACLEELLQMPVHQLEKAGPLLSPGLLEGHYAPQKPLQQLPRPLLEMKDSELQEWWEERSQKDLVPGFLLFQGDSQSAREKVVKSLGLSLGLGLDQATTQQVVVECLSPTGDLEIAARNLFQKLRSMDHSAAQMLYVDPCPTLEGLGAALADRLKRACHRS